MAYSNDPKDFPPGFVESLSPAQKLAWEAGFEFATEDEYKDDEPVTLVYRPKPQP
jgi:hypothetical protein